MQVQRPLLGIDGVRTTGETVRKDFQTAIMAVCNVVKSSLGPIGLDKMIVDEVGDITVTNDGATILQKLDIEHPAGKILVDLAGMQDREIGDGTTSVVLVAGELVKRANDLIMQGVHATTVIAGYKYALKEAVKVPEEEPHGAD